MKIKVLFAVLITLLIDSKSFAQESYLFQQDFSTASLPAGWTNTNPNAVSFLWRFNNPGAKIISTKTSGNGFAIFDNDYFGGVNSNASLESPVINASSNSHVYLTISQVFQKNGNDTARIMISNDNGTSWSTVALFTESISTFDTLFDVSTIAAGNPQVKLRFRYSGNGSGYWAIDDISLYQPYTADAGVTFIVSPSSACKLSDSEPVKLKLKNFGAEPISNFNVSYKAGNSAVITELFTGTIQAYSTADFTFSTSCDLSAVSVDTFLAFTNLAGEQNSSNDSLVTTIKNLYNDISVSPYIQSFEIGDSYMPFFTFSSSNPGASWLQSSGLAYDGASNFVYYGEQSSSWLYSHCFSLDTSKVYQIKFSIKNSNDNYPIKLGFYAGNAPAEEAMTKQLLYKPEISETNWISYSVALKPDSNGEIFFGWNFITESYSFLAIDYFTVSEAPQKNIGVSELLSPQNGCVSSYDSVKIIVTNSGQQLVNNYNLVCKINSVLKANVSITEALPAGKSKIITLPVSEGFKQSGSYIVDVYTVWAEDEDPDDDKHLSTIKNEALNPLLENAGTGFETNETSNWSILDGADQNDYANWMINSMSKNFGQYGISSYISSETSDDWIISPCLNFEELKTYAFIFYDRNNNPGTTKYELWAGKSPDVSSMDLKLGSINGYKHGTFFVKNYIAMLSPGKGIYYLGLRIIATGSGDITLDDLSINLSDAVDPGLIGFVNLQTGCYADTSMSVTVKVANFGSEAVSNIPIDLYNSTSGEFHELITSLIEPGDTLNYTFDGKINLSYNSQMNLTVSLNLNNDANYSNNSIETEFGSSLKNAASGTQSFSIYEMKYWQIKDYNNDSCSWINNDYGTSISYQANKPIANDWMFSNCYSFDKNTKYSINLVTDYNGLPSQFRLLLCTQQDTNSIIQEINLNRGNSMESTEYFGWINVPESGIYYLAFALQGEINLYSTVELYYMNLNEIPFHDLAIVDIISPSSDCSHIRDDSVIIRLANYGKSTETAAQLGVYFDEQELYSQIEFSVEPFDTISVKTDLLLDLTKKEVYSINYTLSPDGDENGGNNQINQIVRTGVRVEDFPYEYALTPYNEESIIFDANVDSNSFKSSIINDSYGFLYEYNENSPDEWILTRCFKLIKDHVYRVQFDYTSDNLNSNIALWLGMSQSPIDMGIKLLDLSPIESGSDTSVFKSNSVVFTCDSTGIYHFGWHLSGDVETGRIWLANSVISHTIKKEIGLTQIISPVQGCNPNPKSNVIVQIKNSGFEEIEKLPIHYRVNNSASVINDTIPFIAAYEEVTFTFKEQVNLTKTKIDLQIWIDIENDEIVENDSIAISMPSLTYHDFANGDYEMGFEEDQILLNYYTLDNFQIFPSFGPASPLEGSKFAVTGEILGNTGTLTTHCFVLNSNDIYTISFSDREFGYQPSYTMQLLIDSSSSFTGNPQVIYSSDFIDQQDYESHTLNYSVPKSGIYYLRWNLTTFENNVYILDGIRISTKCAIQSPHLPADTMFCLGTIGVLSVGEYSSYQWNTGSQSNSISVTSPGVYKLDVVTADGCVISDSTEVYFSDCTSVNENNTENELKVFPNPASQKITIQMNYAIQNSVIKIYDITGNLIYSENLTTNSKVLDISNFSRGLYLIQINGENNSYTSRFIKN